MKTMGHKFQTRLISGLLVFVMVFAAVVTAGLAINYDFEEMFSGLGFGKGGKGTNLSLNTTPNDTAAFITPAGNWGYELKAGTPGTVFVDGERDEAYSSHGFTIPAKYGLPASGSKFDVSMTYDGAYVYVLYEFDKKEEIFWNDGLASGNWYRFDCADFVLNLTGAEATGAEFRILAGVEGGKGVAKTDSDLTAAGKCIKDWYVKHTDKGYNVEFVFAANDITGRYEGDRAFTFTAVSTITTAWDGNMTTQAPTRSYPTAEKAAGAEAKGSPSMVVLRANNDFVTANGNHGYEIYKSDTALELDGEKDDAYTELGFSIPGAYGLPKYAASNILIPSDSNYTLSFAADDEYAYFLYEFEKDEQIYAIPAGTSANYWKYDIADFTLNVTGEEAAGKEFRIGLDSNYEPVQFAFNNFVTGFVADGNYTAVKDPDSNNYNVEFRVPLSLITGTMYGNKCYTFNATCTICMGVDTAEGAPDITERTNVWALAACPTDRANPTTVVIKDSAPVENEYDLYMDYSDVDFQMDGRWGYFINEAHDSFVLDGQKDYMYLYGVKLANAHNRPQLGYVDEPDFDNTYDIYIAADTKNISILWEFTDSDGIITDGAANYYNDAAQFVFAYDGSAAGDGGKVIDYGIGPRAGHLTYDFGGKKIQIPYVVTATDIGFNVEISISRSHLSKEDVFSFMGLSTIARSNTERTYGFMPNPLKNATDAVKKSLSVFHIIDEARTDSKPAATVDGRYSYNLEQTETEILNDGYIDPAYYDGIVFNNKYNRSGTIDPNNTYVLYVAADAENIAMFFDVKDTCIVSTSPSYWHDDCVHFLFNKTGAADSTGGEDKHILLKDGGEGTRVQTINGIEFTITVRFTDDGYQIEATAPRSSLADENVFSFMPRLSIASAPGVNTYGFPANAQGDASDATLTKLNRIVIVDEEDLVPGTIDMSTLYTDISAPVAGTLSGYTSTAAISASLKTNSSVAIVYPKDAPQGLLDLVTLPSGTVRASTDATKSSGGILKDYYDSLNTLKEFLANAKVYEEGNASINNCTYKILVGHVNSYAETQKMVDAIGYDSYGVGVFGNTISIIGPTEQMLKKAVETFMAEVNNTLTPKVLYSGSSPAVAGANLPYVSGATIVTDNGYGSYQIVKQGANQATYDDYCKQLLSSGYKPYAYNPMGGGYMTKTFYNDTDIVTVGYGLRYSILLYSTQSGTNFYGSNDSNLDKTINGMSVHVASRAVSELPNNDDLYYDKVADTVYVHATQDWDLVEIVRLENGEFLIFDAAHTADAEAILGQLYALSNGETPVVAGWFLSHFHQDHIGGLVEIGMKYSDKIIVKNVIQQLGSEHLQGTCYNYRGNQPSTSDKANILNFLPAMENLGAKVSVAATGQTYNFANASVEVLYTFADSMPFRLAADDTNRTGAIFALTLRVGDKIQKFNINGDTTTEEFNMCTKRYGSYLKADVLQVAHHGSGEANDRCTTYYKTIDPSYVIVSRAFDTALSAQSFGASDTAIINYVKAKYNLEEVNVDDVIIYAAVPNGSTYKKSVRYLNVPYSVGNYFEFPGVGATFTPEFENYDYGYEDAENSAPANPDNRITMPIGMLENGSYLYVANTFYGDITTDGTKDNAYTYGIHLKDNKADDANKEASFEVWLVAGQDGKIHVFYEVTDNYYFVTNETGWNSYRQDGADFWYGFKTPGTVDGNFRIKAYNGTQTDVFTDGKLATLLKNDYAVKVTAADGVSAPVIGQPVKYTVEFSIDNNGKAFQNGDMMTFSPVVNTILKWFDSGNTYDEATGKGHDNANLMADHAVSSATGTYCNPNAAPVQPNNANGKHNVLVFSSAPATEQVQRPEVDSDNGICLPDDEIYADYELIGSIDKGANDLAHAQAVYGIGTAYTDFTLDGEMENIYKYGLKVSDGYSDNAQQYPTGNHGFDAYIVYGQDGKVHVFVEVTDNKMTTDAGGNKIGYGFESGNLANYWRRDSVHFYYNFATDGTTANRSSKTIWIGAVAGGDQSGIAGHSGLPETGTYFVKMTDKGYNVEFVLDRNGSDFYVGDYFEFGIYLNCAYSEVYNKGDLNNDGKDDIDNDKYSIVNSTYYMDNIAGKYISPNEYAFDGVKIMTSNSITDMYRVEHNYDIVETPAKCNAEGYTTYTCIDCGYSYVDDYVPATGIHTYDTDENDGHTKCTDCGNTIKINSASLVLKDSIAINFKIKADQFNEEEFNMIVFTFNEETVEVTELPEVDANGYYVFLFNKLGPQHMNDAVTATLYFDYNGDTYESKTVEYSVRKYCDSQLEKASSTAKLKTLLVDLLNYGAAAQVYADHNTGALANAHLTPAQLALGTPVDEVTSLEKIQVVDADYKEKEVVWKGGGLYLEDSVQLKMKFAIPTGSKISDYTAKITIDGDTYTAYKYSPEGTPDVYYAYFNVVTPNQMRTAADFVVCDSEDNVVSGNFTYSIMTYAYNQCKDLASMASATDLQKLVVAMMKYGDSVKAYVG